MALSGNLAFCHPQPLTPQKPTIENRPISRISTDVLGVVGVSGLVLLKWNWIQRFEIV